MKSLGITSLACAAVLTFGCNADNRNERVATDEPVIGTSGEAGLDVASGNDREFVTEMLSTGAAEVQLGKLAAERGASADVKQFGQMMVSDHTKAGEQLKQIAGQYNVQPGGQPVIDEEHSELIAKLSTLRGAEFDRAYIDAMVDGHQDVIDKLQTRVDERDRSAVLTGQAEKDVNVKPEPSDTGAGATLNQWSASTLPIVKGHLERAKAIDDRLN